MLHRHRAESRNHNPTTVAVIRRLLGRVVATVVGLGVQGLHLAPVFLVRVRVRVRVIMVSDVTLACLQLCCANLFANLSRTNPNEQPQTQTPNNYGHIAKSACDQS